MCRFQRDCWSYPQLTVLIYCHITGLEVLEKTKEKRNLMKIKNLQKENKSLFIESTYIENICRN